MSEAKSRLTASKQDLLKDCAVVIAGKLHNLRITYA